MLGNWHGWILIAQEAAQQAENGPAANPLLQFLPMMAMIAVAFYFIVYIPDRRKREKDHKEQQEKLDSLKRNDKVVTTGGIMATVWSMNKDKDYVLVKIDDDKDITMKIRKTHIAEVLISRKAKEDDKDDSEEDSETEPEES